MRIFTNFVLLFLFSQLLILYLFIHTDKFVDLDNNKLAPVLSPELFYKAFSFLPTNMQHFLKKSQHWLIFLMNASFLEVGNGDEENSINCFEPSMPSDYKGFIPVDLSEPMMNFSKKNTTLLPKIEFCKIDTTSNNVLLSFYERFDNVFSFSTLHVNENQKMVSKNFCNLFKPKEEVFLIFCEKALSDSIFAVLPKHPKWSNNQEEMFTSYYLEPYLMEDYSKDDIRKKCVCDVYTNHSQWKANVTLPKIPPEVNEYSSLIYGLFKEHVLISEEYQEGRFVYKVNGNIVVLFAKRNI